MEQVRRMELAILCCIYHLQTEPLTDGSGCSGDSLQMNCFVFGIEQAVELGTAGSHALGHYPFADLARLHCLC